MTVLELETKRTELHAQVMEKNALIASEKRSPTQDEINEANLILDEIHDLTSKIEAAELETRIVSTDTMMKEPKRSPSRPDVRRGVDETRRFRTFGDQLKAIYMASMGTVDPRLTYRASGMTEAVPGDGGLN